jgi:hypothetical protein
VPPDLELDKDRQVRAEPLPVQLGAVAGDHAVLLERPEATHTGWRGQRDGVGRPARPPRPGWFSVTPAGAGIAILLLLGAGILSVAGAIAIPAAKQSSAAAVERSTAAAGTVSPGAGSRPGTG